MEHSNKSITNIVIAKGSALLVSDSTKNVHTEVVELVEGYGGAEAANGTEDDDWEEDEEDAEEPAQRDIRGGDRRGQHGI